MKKQLMVIGGRLEKVTVGAALSAASVAAHAQVTVPTGIQDLFDDGSAMAVAVISAGVVAFAAWRGGLTALAVAKRMLAKVGL